MSFSDWYADLLRIAGEHSPGALEDVKSWDLEGLNNDWRSGSTAQQLFESSYVLALEKIR